jgi:hypothetical protein
MKSLLSSLALLTVLPATVWAQAPAGTEFQVNGYTSGDQRDSAVAMDGSGNFVVVWTSYGQDGDTFGVFGRRFNASGVPQGSEFQVNSYTTNFQYRAAVASDANGNFVVVWESFGQEANDAGIFGQRFTAAGVPQGSSFHVNSYTTGNQASPRMAMDRSGNFLVLWTGYGAQDGSGSGVFGQRFNAAGVRQGSEFQLNSFTTGYQFSPSAAFDGAGNFVVIWGGQYQDGNFQGVIGRRFNASGVPQGSEFVVNSFTTGDQSPFNAVASQPNGNFVVVWQSLGHDGDPFLFGVFGQRFDPSGSRQGSEFVINTYTPNTQGGASLAMDEQGNFVVVWTGNYQDGSGYGGFAQHFDASGAALGVEFQINSFTTGNQVPQGVASSPDGDFVVVWQSPGQDGSGNGVFAQRYGDIIFEDGVDSGDLTRWSSSSTDGGNLSASGAAAMAGTSSGLQAVVNDTNSLFVQDDTPNAESRYRARFYFDPNGFDPGESQSHFRTRILIAQGSGFRLITIVLKRQLGAYTIEARVRRNDGTRADTGFFPISDGPHFIEFDWQRATGPGASDGSLQLFIDNASVSTLSGIDNDQVPVDLVRMGALSVKTGAAGTLYYDQFESRRLRFIGAE